MRRGHNQYEIIPGPEVDESNETYTYIYLDKEYELSLQ